MGPCASYNIKYKETYKFVGKDNHPNHDRLLSMSITLYPSKNLNVQLARSQLLKEQKNKGKSLNLKDVTKLSNKKNKKTLA